MYSTEGNQAFEQEQSQVVVEVGDRRVHREARANLRFALGRIAAALERAPGPESRTIPNPPRPGGVAMATIVS